jgi:hypothetical protein
MSITQAEFEPAVPASERTHAYYLDRAATGIGEFTALLHCRIVACLVVCVVRFHRGIAKRFAPSGP